MNGRTCIHFTEGISVQTKICIEYLGYYVCTVVRKKSHFVRLRSIKKHCTRRFKTTCAFPSYVLHYFLNNIMVCICYTYMQQQTTIYICEISAISFNHFFYYKIYVYASLTISDWNKC